MCKTLELPSVYPPSYRYYRRYIYFALFKYKYSYEYEVYSVQKITNQKGLSIGLKILYTQEYFQ